MTQKVIAMEAKLRAVFAGDVSGVRVSDLCAELGISRQTYYKYKRRFEAEGPAGLVERSRRPHRSPGMIPADVEDEIVRLRKTLPVDNGAQTIAYHLQRGGWETPSVAAIHRALVRRGLVTAQPHKRPRSSYHRFQWPEPNALWQIDATRWELANGQPVWIMDLLDDHSRVALAARVHDGPTAHAAWEAFCAAAQHWGLPARVLSDNGTCFTAQASSGGEAAFERDLRAAGICYIHSSPHHPQTCGKLERFHQTLKKWLATQPSASTHAELQAQIDTFLAYDNHDRPHRALAGATPLEAWRVTPPATPGPPIPASPNASLHTVVANNLISWGRHRIAVGPGLIGQHVLVIARDDDLTVLGPTGLIRRLTLDRTRNYQPINPTR